MALDQLISRALIQQQIRQEDARAIEPPQSEVDVRLMEMRKELPPCLRFNCVTDAGWKAFLAAHGLTPERVESYLRYRLEILRFIEERFRLGIRITPEEIATYYRQTLLPQYAAGDTIPPLTEVSPRIQEILLQRQVNVLFDDWLKEPAQAGRRRGARSGARSPRGPEDGGKEAHERPRIQAAPAAAVYAAFLPSISPSRWRLHLLLRPRRRPFFWATSASFKNWFAANWSRNWRRHGRAR